VIQQGIWLLLAFLVTTVGTGLLRRYALAASLIDIPNARSSHQLPTPRGGGLALVLVFLVALPFLAINRFLPMPLFWALLGSGSMVAIIGFWDDHGHINARWRLLVHFAAAVWGLVCLHGFPDLVLFTHRFELGWIGQLFACLYLVWLLNLYNFMDGIDGIAALEALTVCFGGALLYLLQAQSLEQYYVLWLLMAVVAGVLCWNFPPAKIFMGDAGSGFLGMVLGLFSVQAAWLNAQWFWSWLILLGVFIVDASWTLARRFIRGEKVHQAHRSHAYQFAARQFQAHKPVSIAIAVINLCWLLPWSLMVGLGWLDGFVALMIAYLPLLGLARHFKAGERETV